MTAFCSMSRRKCWNRSMQTMSGLRVRLTRRTIIRMPALIFCFSSAK